VDFAKPELGNVPISRGSSTKSRRPASLSNGDDLGMRSLIFALGFAIALIVNPSASAQKFVPAQVVFPITDFKPDLVHLALLSVEMKFGTGFCLDPECRFVGTNYHVAKIMGKSVRIKGVPSAHLYLDTGADDDGARPCRYW
jgi:hypothetical protein